MTDEEKNISARQEETEPKAAHGDAAAKKARDPGKKRGAWMLHPRSKSSLAIHIILDLLVPYAYLMLCGVVFDRWLRLYNMTTFIFFSYMVLQLAGIVFAIINIVNFVRRSSAKSAQGAHAKKKKK